MKWAVCLENKGFVESLELRKLYQVVEDEKSAQRGCMRVIDETGEAYIYPADMFFPLAGKIDKPAEDRLLAIA
ncbi:MAG: hypothetical protein LBU53_02160 [Zoogloeaceae bacterium]|jgi:hypothetical protein|nr:hypothetical protein [Zoogloeaceae bacterium]